MVHAIEADLTHREFKEEMGSTIYSGKLNGRDFKFLHLLGTSSLPKERAKIHEAINNYFKLDEIAFAVYSESQEDSHLIIEQTKKINQKIRSVALISTERNSGGTQDCDNCELKGGKCCIDKRLGVQKHIEERFNYTDYKRENYKREMFEIKKAMNNFLSAGVDCFTNQIFTPLLANSFLIDFSNLYIISAPSGYGKSTLIDRLRYLGIRQLPKIVTRKLRPGEESDKNIEFVSTEEYNELLKKGEVIGHAKTNKGAYGIRRVLLENVFRRYYNYAIDRDFEAARKIQSEYPDKVKLVALFPSSGFAGFGLEERINKLKMPTEGFGSFIEEIEFLKRSRFTIQDTKDRLKYIIKEANEFEKNLPYFDIVLDKYSFKENEALLLEKMAEG